MEVLATCYPIRKALFEQMTPSSISSLSVAIRLKLTNHEKLIFYKIHRELPLYQRWIEKEMGTGNKVLIIGKDTQEFWEMVKDPATYWKRPKRNRFIFWVAVMEKDVLAIHDKIATLHCWTDKVSHRSVIIRSRPVGLPPDYLALLKIWDTKWRYSYEGPFRALDRKEFVIMSSKYADNISVFLLPDNFGNNSLMYSCERTQSQWIATNLDSHDEASAIFYRSRAATGSSIIGRMVVWTTHKAEGIRKGFRGSIADVLVNGCISKDSPGVPYADLYLNPYGADQHSTSVRNGDALYIRILTETSSLSIDM